MNDKFKDDAEFFQKLIESQKTDEFLEKIYKEERNLNEEKYKSFKNILAYFKNSFNSDDVDISFGLLDRFNPRSGWISVSGEHLHLTNLDVISDDLKNVSNIGIGLLDDDVVELSITMYDIVEFT